MLDKFILMVCVRDGEEKGKRNYDYDKEGAISHSP